MIEAVGLSVNNVAVRHMTARDQIFYVVVGLRMTKVVGFPIYAPNPNPTNHLAMLFTRTLAAVTKW
jgi:hypothetical protein